MKKIIVLFFCFVWYSHIDVYAQDTTAYEVQRTKVNALLAERSAKFGQYDQSLNARTGIFGFQTKRDIKNSNEILRQIALTDNDIFTELKVLLEYKDLQVEQVKTVNTTTSENILGYRRSIKVLQDKSEKLDVQLSELERSKDLALLAIAILSTGLVILGYLYYIKIKAQQNEKAIL